MASRNRHITRRGLLKGAAVAVAGFAIVPRHVLGGEGKPPPSETLGGALIGCGGRGPGTYGEMKKSLEDAGLGLVKLADCDVKFVGKADNKTVYTDFRRVLERKDIDCVAIGTPPHWHALISIAAAEAGKDVLCEKPFTRFIAEGRAVVEAFRRYNRVFQIGTFGRFGHSRNAANILTHKIMRSGLLKDQCKGVYIMQGGVKVKEWSGRVNVQPQSPPPSLDWDMYCGPSQLKPFHPPRFGGTHRCYWDYEGGGLTDMAEHHLDGPMWVFGRDDTAPVEVEGYAPVQHPEVTGMWGYAVLKYADGFTLVLASREWGEECPIKARAVRLDDLSEEDQKKIKEMPDPPPLLTFGQAVKARKPAGGNMPEAAHRTMTAVHLANIAFRTGRKLRFDPVKEQIIGDDEANRLVNQPMRAPWRL